MNRVGYTFCRASPGLSRSLRPPEDDSGIPRAASLPPVSISDLGVYSSPVESSSGTPAEADPGDTAAAAPATVVASRPFKTFLLLVCEESTAVAPQPLGSRSKEGRTATASSSSSKLAGITGVPGRCSFQSLLSQEVGRCRRRCCRAGGRCCSSRRPTAGFLISTKQQEPQVAAAATKIPPTTTTTTERLFDCCFRRRCRQRLVLFLMPAG